MKHRKFLFYLGYAVALLSLLSVFLLSQATQGSKQFESFHQPLLITVAFGIAFLLVIVVYYLFKLAFSYFKHQDGASLSLNILWRSLLLSLIPLALISYFSFKFLNYEFQSSFDEGINDALNNALVLSKKSLNVRAIKALEDSEKIADEIKSYEYNRLITQIDNVRIRAGAYELTVLDTKSFIQAFASADINTIIPEIPEHSEFVRVGSEKGIFQVESDKAHFQIRTLVAIEKPYSPNYYLQVVFHLPDTVSELTEQVNRTITERDRFNYLMPRVNSSFIIVLILVVLLAGLLTILSSINFANDMARPIRDLIKGTKRVSKGDFSFPLIVKRNDDFGTLMQSFNQMTNSLRTATEEIERNHDRIESERAYLETVIDHMTAGVIALDYKYRLQAHNEYAGKLLTIDLLKIIEQDSIGDFTAYHHFVTEVMASYEVGKHSEIEINVESDDESKILICNVTPLPSTDSLHGGYVIIFEVQGQYLQQQKQAAWEEVARRLAHEIKNPLTPILLATERLNYKLSGHLDEKQQQVLSRSVNVITNQVKSLKNMVNDFSDFAKPISAKKITLEFSSLLKDVFDLYRGHYMNIDFKLDSQAIESNITGSEQAFRQVLHNLIKNAIEAYEARKDNVGHGNVSLRLTNAEKGLLLEVIDNGIGLPSNDNASVQVFEPYVTTKEKGTGLGLAIVKKIIHEHHGTIRINNRQDEKGAKVVIWLPLGVKR